MGIKLQKKASVADGIYNVRLIGAETKETALYGNRLLWKFRVVGGDFDGQELSRMSGFDLTPKSNCLQTVESLVGKKLVDDELDIDKLIGKTARAVVEQTESGFAKIVKTMAAATEAEETPF